MYELDSSNMLVHHVVDYAMKCSQDPSHDQPCRDVVFERGLLRPPSDAARCRWTRISPSGASPRGSLVPYMVLYMSVDTPVEFGGLKLTS
jgi:hypothetical protein